MNSSILISEITLKAIKSSGSGGQHVNKVATKIELQFNVLNSLALTQQEKALVLVYLKSRLTKNNVLIMQCQETRSQLKNKQILVERFLRLIQEANKAPKKRIPTKVPNGSNMKRLETKKLNAHKKSSRKKPEI
ncbi:MAG: alternative ribosome rescue aminoacyl-tRNA hydrolase ArfB [Flavobacteriaceae bacterium]|nr:alternative ribosome rescue aminoacyl-tRNA hydrolase ArfB [Flavobacteriaceae bacterium]MDG2351036.1 alternative ribosome rescue aminoacyl-tRNA hydrolase ArfB [Flavobacteriaceae bacterium]